MITHLITNGCSYTYCQNLTDRETNGWPYQLGKKLGIPVINLAKPGSGNDYICRSTYEYVYLEMLPTIKPLWVIGWSQYWRREGWFNKKNDYDVVIQAKSIKDITNSYQRLVLEEWNTEDHGRKTLLFKTQVKTLFELRQDSYLMIDICSPDEDYFPGIKDTALGRRLQPMLDYVYDHRHLNGISSVRHGLNTLPCGHDDLEFHNRFSEILLGKVKEFYLPS